jgi:hypothetical protein
MTDGQREVLETVLRSQVALVRQVRRTHVLLLAAEGVSNVEIAERCNVSRPRLALPRNDPVNVTRGGSRRSSRCQRR